MKRYKVIRFPKAIKEAEKRGIKYYRIITHGGEKLRVAITKKPGPRGGRTIIVSKLKEIKSKKK